MTPASLQAAQPMIDKVNSNGATLKQKLDAMINELDAVTSAMTTG